MKKSQYIISSIAFLASIISCDAKPPPEEASEGIMLKNGKVELHDLTNDSNNCGATGYVCKNGRTCSGSRCLPAWQPLSTTNAPQSREYASAGTVDNRYIISGGCNSSHAITANTYIYNPATDTWSSGPSMSQGRSQHSTNSTSPYGVAVDGGITECSNGYATAGLDMEVLPAYNSNWVTLASNFAELYNLGFGWTGSQFMQYGGSGEVAHYPNAYVTTPIYINILGLLVLNLSTGVSVPCTGFDHCSRSNPLIFKDGGYMRVLGSSAGLKYNITTGSWTEWTIPSGGPDLGEHISIFNPIGNPFRYADDGQRIFLPANTGTVYIFDRVNGWSTDSSTYPSGLCNEGPASWVNGEMIVYGGHCGSTYSTVGGRYQPAAP